MSWIYVVVILGLLLPVIGCKEVSQRRPLKTAQKVVLVLDSVRIRQQTADVHIAVTGTLRGWKLAELTLPDSARVISQLVERGMAVRKGDLLASLWPVARKQENTPVDMFAPITGTVDCVPFGINQIVPPGKSILRVVNWDRLQLLCKLESWQRDYVKAGYEATVFNNALRLASRVGRVDAGTGLCRLDVQNPNRAVDKDMQVQAEILCRRVSGSYINRQYFGNKNRLQVALEEGIELSLYAVGYTDSLALVYPPLAQEKYLRIFKKNLDL